MAAPSGDGAQPSGDAIAIRLAADIHSATGTTTRSDPSVITWLALT
jgi:hypothetical protein